MKIERPSFPWGELVEIITIGFLGGVVMVSIAWGLFRFHFPIEAVLQ